MITWPTTWPTPWPNTLFIPRVSQQNLMKFASQLFGQADMKYFIISYQYFTSLHYTGKYELNKLALLPMCGFIAQLVEHHTGILRGSRVQSLLKPWFFFRLLVSNCLNWKLYYDDHSSLSSTTAVQILFHISTSQRKLRKFSGTIWDSSHNCKGLRWPTGLLTWKWG